MINIKRYEIVVEAENTAEEWWAAAFGEFNQALNILVRDGRMECDSAQKERIIGWAEHLPGWGCGPDHALNPLLVRELG
jgi:hypothetical protein